MAFKILYIIVVYIFVVVLVCLKLLEMSILTPDCDFNLIYLRPHILILTFSIVVVGCFLIFEIYEYVITNIF